MKLFLNSPNQDVPLTILIRSGDHKKYALFNELMDVCDRVSAHTALQGSSSEKRIAVIDNLQEWEVWTQKPINDTTCLKSFSYKYYQRNLFVNTFPPPHHRTNVCIMRHNYIFIRHVTVTYITHLPSICFCREFLDDVLPLSVMQFSPMLFGVLSAPLSSTFVLADPNTQNSSTRGIRPQIGQYFDLTSFH
jgi:hypothetical protein